MTTITVGDLKQTLDKIQAVLRAHTWSGGSVVWGTRGVLVSAVNDDAVQDMLSDGVRPPFAIIGTGAATVDAEEPTLVEQTITIRIVAEIVKGDYGESAILGANKTGGTTASKGRGVAEILPELHRAIGFLNRKEGLIIQFKATSGNGIARTETGEIAWIDLDFTTNIGTQPV